MNKDLISREALKKAFENLASDDYNEPIWYQQTVFETIDNAPTVPLPDFKAGYTQAILDGKTNYSRPKGEWIRPTSWEDGYKGVVCSQCGKKFDIIEWSPEMFFCYNCGADMKEDCINFVKRRRKNND